METTKHTGVEMGGGGGGKKARAGDLSLRVLALVLTLTAAIVIGVDKQTKVVPVTVSPTLPPLDVAVSAKWHHLSAFVYFMATNAIACAYAAISIVLVIATSKGQGMGALIMILDLLMVALLFSGNGAAAAVGVIGYNGNSHVKWKKVCNLFGKFCHQVAASLVISMLGSLVFVLLVSLAAFRLHKKYK